MRGALVVVACALVLALAIGLVRARQDMRDEIDAAHALAQVSALLVQAPARRDDELLAELANAARRFRHLQLRLTDGSGRVLLQSAEEAPASPPLRALIALNDALLEPPRSKSIDMALPRPGGDTWTVRWLASHDSEQREALSQLAEDMAELAGCAALMLLVMRWNMRRAFRPLGPLLAAIARVEQHDLEAMRRLPAMPVRELDAIASSLRHLAGALAEAEARRRVLSVQVSTSQEDERGRIARELHDELGQHLTALRFDTAWLQRRLAGRPEIASVVAGMSEHGTRIQQGLRSLLARLRPLGDAIDGTGDENPGRLQALLTRLVQGWSESPGCETRFELHFHRADDIDADAPLPLDIVLAVYRISQEALTNVARHAQASRAALRVSLRRDAGAAVLAWSVEDDGRGMDVASAWHRGNGLAGLKERIWAAGGDLVLEPACATRDAAAPGLRLRAELRFALARDTVVAAEPA